MSQTISTGVASTNIPGFNFTLQAAPSGAVLTHNVVMFGTYNTLANGISANTAYLGGTPLQARQYFGGASQIAQAYATYRSQDPYTPVYLIGLPTGVPAEYITSLAALNDLPVAYFVSPTSNAAVAQIFDDFLNPLGTGTSFAGHPTVVGGRWGNMSQLLGAVITASKIDTNGATFMNSASSLSPISVNSRYITCLVVPSNASATQATCAAAYAASIIQPNFQAPGYTLTGLPIGGFVAPNYLQHFPVSTRSAIISAGGSTFTTNPANMPMVERAVTTCVSDYDGFATLAFSKFEDLNRLSYIIPQFKAVYQNFLQQKIIVLDPSLVNVNGGNNFITTSVVQAYYCGAYDSLVAQGVCVNAPAFKANCAVVDGGQGLFNAFLPIQLSGNLFQMDCLIQFASNL